jgi:hypothetical protein
MENEARSSGPESLDARGRSDEMVHFVGLDVSVKETSVCVVDDAGKVIFGYDPLFYRIISRITEFRAPSSPEENKSRRHYRARFGDFVEESIFQARPAALQVYARRAKLGMVAQNRCAEVRLRAERKQQNFPRLRLSEQSR